MRAIVVGGGIIGLCSADALIRRGYEVTVVDREAPGNGCSYGNGGLIVPSHFEPLAAPGMIRLGLKMMLRRDSPFGFRGLLGRPVASWITQFMRAATVAHVERCAPVLSAMNLASRELYEKRYSDIEAGYHRSGELLICKTERAMKGEAELAKAAGKLGLRTQLLNRHELKKFETGVEVDAAGAVFFVDDGRLTPSVFMPALRKKLEIQGVYFRDNFPVTDLGEGFVSNGSDRLEADTIVIAAGSWTGRLAKKLKLDLPLLGGKGYGFTIPSPPAMPNYPGILVEGRVAYTPMLDGLRFVGTMEIGDPDDMSINIHRVRGIQEVIRLFFPQFKNFDFKQEIWAGQRPCAPDGMPYIGRTQACKNLIIATGHGMMGMSLGPITGELVAQIAENEEPSVPLDLMSPNRYA